MRLAKVRVEGFALIGVMLGRVRSSAVMEPVTALPPIFICSPTRKRKMEKGRSKKVIITLQVSPCVVHFNPVHGVLTRSLCTGSSYLSVLEVGFLLQQNWHP